MQRRVHGFDLAEDVFLRGPAVVPLVGSGAKPVQRGEEAVGVCDELVFLHEVASDVAEGLVVVGEEGTT